jgi:hypothetical protein
MHRPSGTAASVSVSCGSASLDFDGRSSHGVGGVEDSSGSASDMYRAEVNGGSCHVTMDTNAPSG